MRELISIIVPVYKVENYLHQCVDSILNQTYRNLEVILIDDGSPDSCGEICDQYAENDYRVKVIHQKNGGVSRARNAGLKVVKGQYISFVDGDDWVKEEYIETLYYLLNKYDADISIGNHYKAYGDKVRFTQKNNKIRVISGIEAAKMLYNEYYLTMNVCWGKLFRYELFKDIRFPAGKPHQDSLIAHKYLYNTENVVFTPQPLIFYRQRNDSFTGQENEPNFILNYLEVLEDREEFFRNKELFELVEINFKYYLLIYPDICRFEKKSNDSSLKNRIEKRHKFVKINFNSYDYRIKVKLYYKLFFIAPQLMSTILKIYKKLFWQNN